mgnify:CR=1 FL=1
MKNAKKLFAASAAALVLTAGIASPANAAPKSVAPAAKAGSTVNGNTFCLWFPWAPFCR